MGPMSAMSCYECAVQYIQVLLMIGNPREHLWILWYYSYHRIHTMYVYLLRDLMPPLHCTSPHSSIHV